MKLFKIPALILKQLYTFGSLENTADGVRFGLKNRLSDATLVPASEAVRIDGREIPLERVTPRPRRRAIGCRRARSPPSNRWPSRCGATVHVSVSGIQPLAKGEHELEIGFEAEPFGDLTFKVKDAIAETRHSASPCRSTRTNNYTARDRPARHRVRRATYSGSRSSTSTSTRSTRSAPRATSRTSPAWRRCRSASPGRSRSTASTPRASS